MRRQPRILEIDPTSQLRDCPKVQSSVYWPAPIDQRLNDLVALAERSGERLSKADLLGALVLSAPDDGEELGVLVRSYRRSATRDVIGSRDTDAVVSLEARRPGRRRASASS